MILTDARVLDETKKGNTVIEPFGRKNLGSDSYDAHLDRTLALYKEDVLDAFRRNELTTSKISEHHGFHFLPGRLFLGVTREYSQTRDFVQFLEGKSSCRKVGIDVHSTARKGDIGYCNTWTLEISVRRAVRIHPGMPIGQRVSDAALRQETRCEVQC